MICQSLFRITPNFRQKPLLFLSVSNTSNYNFVQNIFDHLDKFWTKLQYNTLFLHNFISLKLF